MSTRDLSRDVEEGEEQLLPKRASAGPSRRRTAVALALAAALLGVGAVAARKSGVSLFQYEAGADALKLTAVADPKAAEAKAAEAKAAEAKAAEAKAAEAKAAEAKAAEAKAAEAKAAEAKKAAEEKAAEAKKAAEEKAADAKDHAANNKPNKTANKTEEHKPQGLYGDVLTDTEFADAMGDFVDLSAGEAAFKSNYMKIMSTLTGSGDHLKAKEEAEAHIADIVDMLGAGTDHYTKMEAATILIKLADTEPRRMSIRNAGAISKCMAILRDEEKKKDKEFFPEKTVVTTLFVLLKPN